jgi:hypothetical protein
VWGGGRPVISTHYNFISGNSNSANAIVDVAFDNCVASELPAR